MDETLEALEEMMKNIKPGQIVTAPFGAEMVSLLPSRLRVKCGDFEITGDSGKLGRPIGGWQVKAAKNGEPFPFRRLVLTVDFHGVVTVDAEFLPKGTAGEPPLKLADAGEWGAIGDAEPIIAPKQ